MSAPCSSTVSEFVLYFECTTMRLGLMNRKRRKARRAMEQHGIRVVLVMLPAGARRGLDGDLGRATMLERVDSIVEMDIERGRNSVGVRPLVAGSLELLKTLTDVVLLRRGTDLEAGLVFRAATAVKRPSAD